jgi:hypothetical protein
MLTGIRQQFLPVSEVPLDVPPAYQPSGSTLLS